MILTAMFGLSKFMKAVLKLEAIGDNIRGINIPGFRLPSRYWVKKGYIKFTTLSVHVEWEYINANTTDYSQSDSVGSRGVYKYYWLDDGEVYWVNSPESWGRSDNYYCVVINGEIRKVSKEVAESCLSLPLE